MTNPQPLFPVGEMPISGEVQFWRMRPEDWERALRSVRELGITTIATYLSWRRHEPTPGSFDLRGGHGPELDVHRFLSLCAENGIRVILKPGPWICAEEPGGGFPDWLLADDSIIALDHEGRPVSGYNPPFKHPMPSYASTVFRELAGSWIRRVWEDLAAFIGSDGPVVATQYDNEPSLGFQDSMYGFDHHPDAIAAWHRYRGHVEAPPVPRHGGPSEPTELEMAWAAWQRRYIADYLHWLQQVGAAAGAGHLAGSINLNTHPVRGWPQDGSTIADALEQTVVGEDHYFVPPLDEHDLTGLAIAAAQARRSSTPLRWAPEMQAGIWRSPGEHVDYPDPTDDEMLGWWAAALALGYQGFNLYMLVNRENWEHAPIDREGHITVLGARLKELIRTVTSIPDLHRYRTIPDETIPWSDDERIAAYRVRGTQAHPETEWDAPTARAMYDATEHAALDAVRSGRQFDLDTCISTGSPATTITPGHLVRILENDDGEGIVFVVRWSRAHSSDHVTLNAPRSSTWERLTHTRTRQILRHTGDAFVVPSPDNGLDIYRIATQ